MCVKTHTKRYLGGVTTVTNVVPNGHKWSQMVRIRSKTQVLAVANVGGHARNTPTHYTLLKQGSHQSHMWYQTVTDGQKSSHHLRNCH